MSKVEKLDLMGVTSLAAVTAALLVLHARDGPAFGHMPDRGRAAGPVHGHLGQDGVGGH